MVVEFRPVIADGLAATASVSLLLGVAAALLFAALGWALRRAAAKERRLSIRIEQDRRLAAIGEMSAVLAHEIRNPLTSLKGHALLLQEVLPSGRSRDKANRVVQETERLEALTTDLLSFVRSGALCRRAVDPVALVRSALEAVGAQHFVLDARGAPLSWSLDADRFRQVLENIFQNAAQATEHLVAEAGAELAPATVSVRVERGDLTVEVRDNGPGIPEGQELRIFEAFHTLRTRGTGLGLAVAQRVVHQHGGTIEARNHSNGGAVLTVRVPPSTEVTDGDHTRRGR